MIHSVITLGERMEHYQEDDLTRVKELLRRTGEFIAYFELAESKMMEWQQEIEHQAAHLQIQAQKLEKELLSIHKLFSEAGTTNFRLTAEKALAQGESNLKNIERSCNQFAQNFQQQQEKLKVLTDQSLEKIERHNKQAMNSIATQLSKYDVQHFHRIASESCDHIERVANDAVGKSNKLLKMFQFRSGLFTVLTTILTAFIIVLYLNDESPWEMHHQALNERQAGRLLLQVWPNLTLSEKAKILKHEVIQHG